MQVEEALATGFGPAATIVLRQAAAGNDELAMTTWCAELARVGQLEAARAGDTTGAQE